jgi:hypothetical protein
VAEIRDVLDSIGDTCPQCPAWRMKNRCKGGTARFAKASRPYPRPGGGSTRSSATPRSRCMRTSGESSRSRTIR